MRKSLLAAFLASVLAVPGVAVAQDKPTAAPAQPEAKDEGLKLGIFDVTGYVDISVNHLSRRNVFTSGFPSRVFDLERSGGALRQLAVTLANQPKEGLGGLLNITVGKDADIIAPYKTSPQKGNLCTVATKLDANGNRCTGDHFDLTQAFLQYASGSWTFIGGKYVTLAGAEVINTPTDTNFSRSILFGYAIPFSHTGLRATYAFSDTFSLIGGVNQGWDDIKDTNSGKTGEVGLAWSPSKIVSLGVQTYFGKERAAGLTKTELAAPLQLEGQRKLLDAVLTINATEKLTFIVNYDKASQANTVNVTPVAATNSKWDGYAGYANYQFNDHWRLSFRTEAFNDKQGYRTGVVQKWKENTLTVAWLPTKPIELRAEVRRDRSNVASFLDRDGVTGRNNNTSYGLQFLYKL
ncbi:MAG: outer membrane beta-barrel protein [Burkholderiales bacterium]